MTTTVPTRELQLGMFVTKLDRPWLETPFLLQGFLIEDEEQIALLQQYCASVVIDRAHSIGNQYQGRRHERDDPLLTANITAISQGEAGDGDNFLPIARRLREKTLSQQRIPSSPRISPVDRQSRLEPELIYSAPIIDDVHRTLQHVREAIDSNSTFDLSRVSGLVDEMAAGVERNPDAMLWLARLRKTDEYSYDHAVDVSVHLMVFARFLGLPSDEVEQLGLAGLMQDIGKIQIDPEVLAKPTALTDAEYEHIKSHVASSLDLLVGQRDFSIAILEIVAAHHERYDASGYPRRLNRDRIKLAAELAGLIDTYCAMTRHRVYSDAISSQNAMEKLIKLRGTKFRDALVDQFIQCVGLYPIGTLVQLNSGEVAVVVQQYHVRRLKPRLLVLLAPDKSVERRPRSLDLMLDPAMPSGEPYRILHALPSNAYGIDPGEYYID